MINDYEIETEITKTNNPLVKIRCNNCGDNFILRGSVDKDGSLTTDLKMCFCGSKDIQLTLVK
jgi:hypothetical protein